MIRKLLAGSALVFFIICGTTASLPAFAGGLVFPPGPNHAPDRIDPTEQGKLAIIGVF